MAGLSIAPIAGSDFQPQKWGQYMAYFAEITFDSSYPTGGEVLDPDDVGLQKVLGVVPMGSAGGYAAEWVPSTGKILMRGGAASGVLGAEAANATNMATVVLRAIVFGY